MLTANTALRFRTASGAVVVVPDGAVRVVALAMLLPTVAAPTLLIARTPGTGIGCSLVKSFVLIGLPGVVVVSRDHNGSRQSD